MLTFMCHGVGTWAKARHDFNTTEAFNEYREAFINNATSKYNAVCHPPTLCITNCFTLTSVSLGRLINDPLPLSRDGKHTHMK